MGSCLTRVCGALVAQRVRRCLWIPFRPAPVNFRLVTMADISTGKASIPQALREEVHNRMQQLQIQLVGILDRHQAELLGHSEARELLCGPTMNDAMKKAAYVDAVSRRLHDEHPHFQWLHGLEQRLWDQLLMANNLANRSVSVSRCLAPTSFYPRQDSLFLTSLPLPHLTLSFLLSHLSPAFPLLQRRVWPRRRLRRAAGWRLPPRGERAVVFHVQRAGVGRVGGAIA